MGDEILMKFYKIILLASISCLTALANNSTQEKPNIEQTQGQIQKILAQDNETKNSDIQEYDKMFQSINTPRKGLNETNINKLQDPFLVPKRSKIIHDDNASSGEALGLHAIFNDRAKINNKWYKVGEKVGDYTLKKIKASSVMLVNKDQNLELNITKGRNNVGIKIK